MISIINSGSHGVTANKGSAATLIAYMEKERLAERDVRTTAKPTAKAL